MTVEVTTVYPAAAIYTMDPSQSTASAVAVKGDRFWALGSLDEMRLITNCEIDNTFADKILLPGFVEAHSHGMASGLWLHTYCGFFDRSDPDGKKWPGCKNIGDVIERLRMADNAIQDPNEPLLAWGLDPIYFSGERLVGSHLDLVSLTRPIFVLHASAHLATVNSALMRSEGIDASTPMEGIPKDDEGNPVGELQEPAAMSLAGSAFRSFFGRMKAQDTKWALGRLANKAGITTLTDLGNPSSTSQTTIDEWREVVDHRDFPARVFIFDSPAMSQTTAANLLATREKSSEKLRLGAVKVVLDGSIQGYTARLRSPGYLNDRPNGIWVFPPEQLTELLRPFHEDGLLIHVHCNGDEAVDVFLETVETLLSESPKSDHRYTIQHCQLTSPEQYERIADLEMCVNLFSNHTWYWGDQHISSTVGPERASRMNSARTALNAGVPISMHCDAPVTPLGSLHVAWAAINRKTASGSVLGAEERISVEEALHAITLGAAYQLKMDTEIGSITPGKFADLAVLEDDPYKVDPNELRDVSIWGTMSGGKIFPAENT